MNRQNLRILLLLLLSIPPVAHAHDCFLFPSKFRVEPGESLKVYIHITDTFPGSPRDWDPERVTRFLHVIDSKMTDLTGIVPQDSPRAAVVVPRDQGTHLFALDWKARLIELKPDQFLKYLQAEGLDHIIELRKQRGETEKTGRERYSRYVKTLVQVGDRISGSINKVIGQKIEIVPLVNPYTFKVGDSIQVQVLFDGKPLQNGLISGTYAGFTDKPDTYAQGVRTDKHGKAVFRLTHAGPWMVRIVHMVPLQNSPDADWESFWASLTFEVK